jgi:hypothetical protein
LLLRETTTATSLRAGAVSLLPRRPSRSLARPGLRLRLVCRPPSCPPPRLRERERERLLDERFPLVSTCSLLLLPTFRTSSPLRSLRSSWRLPPARCMSRGSASGFASRLHARPCFGRGCGCRTATYLLPSLARHFASPRLPPCCCVLRPPLHPCLWWYLSPPLLSRGVAMAAPCYARGLRELISETVRGASDVGDKQTYVNSVSCVLRCCVRACFLRALVGRFSATFERKQRDP